ncbi:MAG: microcystin-dependent protein [Motiliproteus sp.]|jgi:microcystin-dependent protein
MTGGETGPGYEGTIREGLSQLPEIDGPCHHIAFDGTSVWAFGTDSDVIGLDEEDGEPVPWNIGPAASLAFDRVSGSFLVARDGNVFSYEFKDGLPRPLIAPDYRPLAIEHDAPVISIVTPENNLRTQAGQAVGWATACEDGTVHLWGWNLNSHGHHHGLPQPLQDERGHPIVLHHDGLRALAFSENGRMLVTGSESGEARLWETTTGKAVCDPKGFEVVITHDAAISAVTFGSGGRLVAGERVPVTNVVTAGAGGTVRVWDVEALQGPHQRFQGDLSNVRLYPQALKQDEIEAAILKDLPEIQVGTIFPLDFSLHNDQQQHVLYLTDEPQQLHLDITNVGRRNVMLPSGKGKANDEGHSAAPTESTLEIRFRPGTLKPESRIALSTPDVDHAQKLGHIDDSANWALRQTRDADGTDVIHLLRKSAASNAGNGTADAAATLLPGETLYLTLGGVLANVSLGTHSTRVQLKYRLHYDQDTPLSGSRLHYLRVLNMSDSRLQTNLEDLLGKSVTVQASLESVKGGQTTLAGRVAALESNLEITKKIEQTEYLLELGQYFEHGGPLVAGIVGVPAVINDGTSNNRLQLRIDNRNTEPGHAAALNSDHSPIFRVYLYHFSNLDWSLLSSGDLDSVSKLTVFELPVAVEHPKEGEPKESEFPRVSDHWQARKVVEDHLAYIEITRKVGVGDSEKFQGLDLILEDFTCSADDRANRSAAEKPQTGTAYVNIWYQHVGVGEDQNKSNLEGWLRVPVERSPILPHGDSTLVSRSLSLIDNAYLGFHHQDVQRGFDPGTPDSAVSIDANGALQIASKDAIGLYPGAQPTGASVPQGTRGLVLKNDGEGVQVALDGGLQATGDIDAVGAISAASLTVKGDITVEGKVGPQDGLGSYLVPRGAIIMWNGDPRTNIQTPPDGWVLCDGKNGTPDLRSRFIISAGPGDASNELSAYSRGNTGGQEQVRLTEPQLPGHVHYGATAKDGAHQHLSQRTSRADNDDNDTPGNFMGDPNREYYSSYDVGRVTQTGSEHSHGFKTESTGGSGEHENRPPYYALYYIMKL